MSLEPPVDATQRGASPAAPRRGPDLRYLVPCTCHRAGQICAISVGGASLLQQPAFLHAQPGKTEGLASVPESRHLKTHRLGPLLALMLRNQIPPCE